MFCSKLYVLSYYSYSNYERFNTAPCIFIFTSAIKNVLEKEET